MLTGPGFLSVENRRPYWDVQKGVSFPPTSLQTDLDHSSLFAPRMRITARVVAAMMPNETKVGGFGFTYPHQRSSWSRRGSSSFTRLVPSIPAWRLTRYVDGYGRACHWPR